jgi:hypothetical protein
MSEQQYWTQPIVFLGRICCSKERENLSNSNLQDRIFQQEFLSKYYCHVWGELFFAHTCNSLADCRRWVWVRCVCDVHNSLNEMFAKCGSIVEARKVFHSMAIQNIMCLHGVPELWDVTRNGWSQRNHLIKCSSKEVGRIQTVNFAGVLTACASAAQHLKNTCMLMNMNLVNNVFDCGELWGFSTGCPYVM